MPTGILTDLDQLPQKTVMVPKRTTRRRRRHEKLPDPCCALMVLWIMGIGSAIVLLPDSDLLSFSHWLEPVSTIWDQLPPNASVLQFHPDLQLSQALRRHLDPGSIHWVVVDDFEAQFNHVQQGFQVLYQPPPLSLNPLVKQFAQQNQTWPFNTLWISDWQVNTNTNTWLFSRFIFPYVSIQDDFVGGTAPFDHPRLHPFRYEDGLGRGWRLVEQETK